MMLVTTNRTERFPASASANCNPALPGALHRSRRSSIKLVLSSVSLPVQGDLHARYEFEGPAVPDQRGWPDGRRVRGHAVTDPGRVHHDRDHARPERQKRLHQCEHLNRLVMFTGAGESETTVSRLLFGSVTRNRG